ncbi:MAG TPA: S8 family serine peptidase [Methylomirabilota bacterium]|nr:S8 family serine peptidase [Methylomirabilota bacterium]
MSIKLAPEFLERMSIAPPFSGHTCTKPFRRWFLHLWCVAALTFAAAAQDKSIRLRNQTIQTPRKAQIQAATADQEQQKGLWLIQFEGAFIPAWGEQLKGLGVELVTAVPDDAYIADLKGAKLGAIKKLQFVRWVGPYKATHKIHPKLSALRPAEFSTVRVLLKPGVKGLDRLVALRTGRGGKLLSQGRFGTVLETQVTLQTLQAFAASPAVLWLEPAPQPKLYDALAAQIIAGEVEGGLSAAIHELGFTGEGVTVAVADSGLMAGTAEDMHPDLEGRVTAFFHYGQLEDAGDEHSHGTHVTGIIAGDGATGETDEEGYLYGLGIAPKANIVAQRIFDGLGGYHAPPTFETMTRHALQAGAEIGSNSWGDDTQGRYDLSAMEFDALVRDGDAETPGDQQYILEFSAGNSGPGTRTIGSPAVAKNVIATGASQNNRLEFILYAEGQEAMADFSSRGPCEDGRIKPDIVAPGTWIASLQSSAATDENAWLPISPNYLYQGGTSQSGPQVSGAAAVFVQYYRETHNGQTPSPALVKAALINSAVDMNDADGTRPVPNNDEGWGRVNLPSLIGGDLNFELLDQTETLATGQVYERRFFVADPDLPLKLTLVYTDVPGFPGAIPALVNDLDLEVVSPSGVTYRGNQFLNGESVPNPAGADKLNNVEGVHLFVPEAGEHIVRVRARNVAADARKDTASVDQDFALVISGGVPFPGQAYVALDRAAYTVPAQAAVRVIDFDLAGQNAITVRASSSTETPGFPIQLAAAGNRGVFTGIVQIAAGPALNDTLLQVKHGDTISVTYADASSGESVVGSANIDTAAPLVSNVRVTHEFGAARIQWATDEPARGVVEFGATASLGSSVTNTVYQQAHAAELPDLRSGTTYFYRIVAEDRAGNKRVADNNGQLFSFVAQGAPPVLLVNAYEHSPEDEGQEIPVTTYTDALNQTGVPYDVWNVAERGSPPLATLRNYRIVMWRINDSFWDSSIITAEQEATITSYVNGGGSFFMASMEILSRLGASQFKRNILQIDEFVQNTDPFGECPTCDEDHGAGQIIGSLHDSTTSGVNVEIDYSLYPSFEFDPIFIGPDVSDTFVPTTNAVTILTEAEGRTVGMRWPRVPQDGQGRVVFLSFPLDGIPMTGQAPNTRASFLRNIFGFLAPGLNGAANLSLDREMYTVPSQVNIELGDSDLAGARQTTVRISSESTPQGAEVALSETASPGVFRGFAFLVNPGQALGPARIAAKEGDIIRVTYTDASSGSAVSATADVDTTEPTISAVQVEPDFENATISWETDEFADSLIQYGESAFLGKTAFRAQPQIDHELLITGLQPDRTYFYQVVSRDEAGNTQVDDNNGQLYTFKTLAPLRPPIVTDFENGPADWDIFIDDDIASIGWELGTPNNGIAQGGHSGQKAWGTNLRGEFFDSAHTFLISPAIHVPESGDTTLRFWHTYDFTAPSTFEYAQLLLFTNTLTQPILLKEYNEFTPDWEEEVINLSAHAGRVVQLVWEYLLFDLEEAGATHHGWVIDDISVTSTNSPRGNISVQNNLAQARFRLLGPTVFNGSGLAHQVTNAPAGEYTLSFEPVPYYTTPAPQTKTLTAGQTLQFSGNYTFPDANQNQISDLWEQQFPRTGGDPLRRDDADGDGASDYHEFLAGTNPLDGNSSFRLLTPMPSGPNRVQLRWFSANGRDYQVLGSTNGVAWNPQSNSLKASGAESSFSVSGITNYSTLFRVRVTP